MFTLRGADGRVARVGAALNNWIEVQDGRYAYLASDVGDGVDIRFVVAGYLACEVSWQAT